MERHLRRLGGKLRGYFRVEVLPDRRLAENVRVQPQDLELVIRSVRELLADLERRQAARVARQTTEHFASPRVENLGALAAERLPEVSIDE